MVKNGKKIFSLQCQPCIHKTQKFVTEILMVKFSSSMVFGCRELKQGQLSIEQYMAVVKIPGHSVTQKLLLE